MEKTKVQSAIVSTLLMAVLSVAMYILGIGDIFQIDSKVLTNVIVMSLMTGIVSLIKSSGTDAGGYFAGVKITK